MKLEIKCYCNKDLLQNITKFTLHSKTILQSKVAKFFKVLLLIYHRVCHEIHCIAFTIRSFVVQSHEPLDVGNFVVA